MKRELIYLAVPYTCKGNKANIVKDRIEGERFRIITEIAVLMFNEGLVFFSPITQSHVEKQIARNMNINLSGDWETWKRFDLSFLSFCTALYIAKIPGWNTSVGVLAELEEAKRLDLPIHFVIYDEEKQTIKIKKAKDI